jgi:glyoxylase-like metal-dependent hydrolase (beta-lactamase superfamily II)
VFGLDPKDIKYAIVTHAHDDRYWGATMFQTPILGPHHHVGSGLGSSGKEQ